MYAECLMVSQGQTRPDTEMTSIKHKENLSSIIEVEQTPEYRSQVQDNEKYIGAQLLPAAHTNNQSLKFQLSNKGIDTVLVAPSVASVQTAFDIFGHLENISIFIEPLLQQRICSTASIPTDLSDFLGEFQSKPDTLRIEDKRWFLSYGKDVNQDENANPQDICMQAFQYKGTFETKEDFLDRNLNARKEIFDYQQKAKKKVAIVAHPSMLETLTATGWHQNGELVCPIRFNFGEWKREHVFIQGVQGEAEESHVPFCG